MSNELKQILDVFINIDRYQLMIEEGDAALVPTDNGEWVPFDQVNGVVKELIDKCTYLQGENNQLKGINHQLSSQSNSRSSVTACPKCGYPQEEDGMRRKECPSCEFVWLVNSGY
jgi:predicted Zn-ribbon and HTH transcriptional regulator